MKRQKKQQWLFSDEDIKHIAEASQFLIDKGYQLRYVRCDAIDIRNEREGISFFVCLDNSTGDVSVTFENRREPSRSGESFRLVVLIYVIEHCDFLMENQMEHILWLLNYVSQHYGVFSNLKLCRYYRKLFDTYKDPVGFVPPVYP